MIVTALLEQPCNKSDNINKVQLVSNLLRTCNKPCEHNLLTACLQTCYKLWDFYVCSLIMLTSFLQVVDNLLAASLYTACKLWDFSCVDVNVCFNKECSESTIPEMEKIFFFLGPWIFEWEFFFKLKLFTQWLVLAVIWATVVNILNSLLLQKSQQKLLVHVNRLLVSVREG